MSKAAECKHPFRAAVIEVDRDLGSVLVCLLCLYNPTSLLIQHKNIFVMSCVSQRRRRCHSHTMRLLIYFVHFVPERVGEPTCKILKIINVLHWMAVKYKTLACIYE